MTDVHQVRRSSVVRRALMRFLGAAAAALMLVGVGSVLVAHDVSRDLALRHAVANGRTFAVGVGAPLVDGGVKRGDPRSLEVFNEVMSNRLKESSMAHIKIWDSDGTIVWSDQAHLRGRRFPLEREVQSLFDTGGVVGYISKLDKPENVEERGEGELLEVYAAAESQTGETVIVESYWSTAQIDKDAGAVMRRIAPLSVGALLLFALVVFPLAWSLARRVERVQGENAVLLQHALDASDQERRRIARDLHDGVLQDVTAVGYELSTVIASMPEPSKADPLLERAAARMRRIGDALRSTMADIYPVNLTSRGLTVAVQELAARAQEEGGVTVRVDVEAMADESLEATRLSYRVIREGLRNVLRHAEATHASVTATRVGDTVHLIVDDDGRGPDETASHNGHLGLALLRDTMRDVGGTLELGSRRGGGTHLLVTFPRDLAKVEPPKVFARTRRQS
jgi:signal transduction histidine kinase